MRNGYQYCHFQKIFIRRRPEAERTGQLVQGDVLSALQVGRKPQPVYPHQNGVFGAVQVAAYPVDRHGAPALPEIVFFLRRPRPFPKRRRCVHFHPSHQNSVSWPPLPSDKAGPLVPGGSGAGVSAWPFGAAVNGKRSICTHSRRQCQTSRKYIGVYQTFGPSRGMSP